MIEFSLNFKFGKSSLFEQNKRKLNALLCQFPRMRPAGDIHFTFLQNPLIHLSGQILYNPLF